MVPKVTIGTTGPRTKDMSPRVKDGGPREKDTMSWASTKIGFRGRDEGKNIRWHSPRVAKEHWRSPRLVTKGKHRKNVEKTKNVHWLGRVSNPGRWRSNPALSRMS